MSRVDMRRIAARIVAILAATQLAAGCGGGSGSWSPFPPDGGEDWEWTELGGPPAATPELVANHETLVVAGSDLLLGTSNGIWRRPLAGNSDWTRSGLDGRAIHALVASADGTRIFAAGYDPRDERAPTAWYSTTNGLDWTAAATWPRGAPGSANPGVSFRFASLEPDPVAPNVVYGGLDADSIAVTVDGGGTWLLANGATAPNFGYPCVAHRPRNAAVLLQGCELPLDVAWVGAQDVNHADRFRLTRFRFLFGYPQMNELGNRRINSIVKPLSRDDRVLVGVEGGLVELTSASGVWGDRADVDARWYFRSDGGAASHPYVYVRAIAPLSGDGRHALFGGTLNGPNDELMLFETANGGATVERVATPFDFADPRVEQAVRLAADDVLLVISDLEGGERRSLVYRLGRP